MARYGGVRVIGYRQFQTSLRRLSKEASRELNRELKAIAKDVATDARGHVEVGPAEAGQIRSSVRPYATPKGAGIRMGGARYPYVYWLVFGGHVGRDNSVARARSWGRYLMPAFLRRKPEILRRMRGALGRAVRGSGLRPG